MHQLRFGIEFVEAPIARGVSRQPVVVRRRQLEIPCELLVLDLRISRNVTRDPHVMHTPCLDGFRPEEMYRRWLFGGWSLHCVRMLWKFDGICRLQKKFEASA